MRLIRLFKKELASECSEWVEENLISKEQAVKICDRYNLDYKDQSGKSYGYSVLVGLGYLFIGLAVITLVSANWDNIPRAARMLGLISLTALTNLFALKKYQEDKPSEATGFFFLGALFYGASIMLIAQIYHIEEHYPNGILWWAIGVLPLALLLQSSLLFYLTTALSFTWFFVETSLNYYPVVFPLFLGALAWHVFKTRQSNLLFLAFMFGAGLWLEYTLAWFVDDEYRFNFGAEHFIFACGLFIVFHGASKWFASRENNLLIDYGTVLGLWTLRFAIFILFIFSFESLWKELIKAKWEQPGITLVLAIGLSALGIFLSISNNKQYHSTTFISSIYILATYVVMQANDVLDALLFQVATNVVLVAIGIWLIVKGIRESITHYFFLGVSSILLTGLLRYMDLVGDYIGASILFIIFAVILLSAARFWKSHQQSLQSP